MPSWTTLLVVVMQAVMLNNPVNARAKRPVRFDIRLEIIAPLLA